ncbi:MAG: cytochrome c [Sandaracinaceae bacterium]|nr:cytochrome c [Sandaracinaceae bacterium]
MRVARLRPPSRPRTSAFAACLAATVSVACDAPIGELTPVASTLLPAIGATLASLPDGRLVIEREDAVLVVDPEWPEREPVVLGAPSLVGRVRRAVRRGEQTFVLTDRGVFLLAHEAFMRAPVSDALGAELLDVVRLEGPAGPELWVATRDALYRVVGERAQRVDLEADLADVSLAVARRPSGAEALWVRLPGRVLELRVEGARLEAARVVLERTPARIEGDANGRVWLVHADRLESVGADRRLRDHGPAPARLVISAHGDDVWLLDADRSRVHADGELFHLAGFRAPPADAPSTVGADGALYTVHDGRLERHAVRHRVRVSGSPDGAVIVRPLEVRIETDGADPRIEARVGDRALEVAGEPPRVVLAPGELGDGLHTLELDVRFADGTLESRRRARFEVISRAGWAGEVAAIYEQHCGDCHGEAGPANTRLDEPARWRPIFEVILANVRDGRMPLGRAPLGARDIALIEAWGLAEFPE